MSKRKRAAYIFWLLLSVIPVAGVILSIFYPGFFITSQEEVRRWISQFGSAGILVFILIQIIQVIITPISHYATSIVGGFLYGPILGGVWNWIGRVIGQGFAYYIGLKVGRPWVEKWVDEETIARFDELIKGNDETLVWRVSALFFMIFLPFFPDDEISYICGLAGFNLRYFAWATLLGHVGGSFALAYAGAGIDTRDTYFWLIMAVTFTFFVALFVSLWKIRRTKLEDKSTE